MSAEECWNCGVEDDGGGVIGGDGYWLCDDCDNELESE